MKILMYTGAFLPKIGGAELVVHYLAEGLASIGADITVATFYKSRKSLFCNYNLERLYVPRGLGRCKSIYPIYETWKLKRLIKKHNPDIIHVHYLYPTGYKIVRLKEQMGLGIPIVVTSHGIDIQKNAQVHYGYRLEPAKEKQILYTAEKVDKLIAISEAIWTEYVKIGVEVEKISEIANPIAYDAINQSRKIIRKALNIRGDIPIILSVGRNHPKKGFKLLLDIIKIVKEKRVPVMCILVGHGVTELKNYASQLKISDSVMFFEETLPAGVSYQNESYGPTEQIVNFYAVADIYAMTSLIEGCPLVTAEAMAAGKAVIAMKADGPASLLQDGINGILVDGDHNIFADSLIELINNKKKRKNLGRNAKKIAVKYSREVIARKHMVLYQEIANRNRNINSHRN